MGRQVGPRVGVPGSVEILRGGDCAGHRVAVPIDAESAQRDRASSGHAALAAKWQATLCVLPICSSGGSCLGADVLRHPAPRAEPAPRRRVDRARDVALEPDPLAPAAHRRLLHVGHRGQQRLGVGVVRAVVERLAVADLDDLAEIHHRDLGAEVPDDGEVVGDEQEGDAELPLQVLQEVHHLRLDRHVERGHRLVGHQQLRLQGERAGDTDALALAAGELARVAVVVLGVQPDDLEQLLDPVQHLLLGHDLVHPQRRADDRCRRCAGGSASCRDPGRSSGSRCATAASACCCQLADLPAVELHRARRRVEQPGDQPPGGGLAAAGLADQAQAPPRGDLERDPVDGLHLADRAPEQPRGAHREVLREVGDLEDRRRVVARPDASGQRATSGVGHGSHCASSPAFRSACGSSAWLGARLGGILGRAAPRGRERSPAAPRSRRSRPGRAGGSA